MAYGAARCDWAFLAKEKNLVTDLLPVVSKPRCEISPNSTLTDYAKIPSQYNPNGQVVGFSSWTSHMASMDDVRKWADVQDYGICVQTRRLRAIDIDIDCQETVEGILASLPDVFTGTPQRFRADSAKILIPFYHTEPLSKITFKAPNGIIELLADGQQFVAFGTHQKGERYQWLNLEVDFPVLSAADIEKICSTFSDDFGYVRKGTGVARLPDPIDGPHTVVDDGAFFKHLQDNGYVTGRGRKGEYFIECAYAHEHTTKSGPTATVYFPAGSNGFVSGAVVCKHAHCQERTTTDWYEGYGYTPHFDFPKEVLPLEEMKDIGPPARVQINGRGEIESTVNNLLACLDTPQFCGAEIIYDSFQGVTNIKHAAEDVFRPFRDTDYTRLRSNLEGKGFTRISIENIRSTVHLVAEDNSYDSAIDWLTTRKWDGVERINSFAQEYLGAEDTPYIRAVVRYMWTALAGRTMRPGIKADMMPIYVSKQGTRKTTGIAAMAPRDEMFLSMDLSKRDPDLFRKMQGKVVGEIGEMHGLNSSQIEGIKSFMTETKDVWIPKYMEAEKTHHRRIIFIGNTNETQFLADPTGNRRFLPFDVGYIAVERIKQDCEVLWAEALQMFNNNGVMWQDADRLGAQGRRAYEVDHAWTDNIEKYLNSLSADSVFTTQDVLRDAIGISADRVNRRHQMDVANILRAYGYRNAQRRRDEHSRVRYWVKEDYETP